MRRHPRILVVDDDPVVLKFVRASLQARDYEVITAMDGVEALRVVEIEQPDMVILDKVMPKMDGFEVCRRIREWSQIPIIMLSAFGKLENKVDCLDAGADDYVVKPFGVSELVARVRAVLRRSENAEAVSTPASFTAGELKINFAQRLVTIAGKEVKLTPTEYNLLQEFVTNAGKVLTHSYLLHRVWGPEYAQEKEYLRVFVGHLRAKIEPDPANPKYVVTVSGVGYQFKDAA